MQALSEAEKASLVYMREEGELAHDVLGIKLDLDPLGITPLLKISGDSAGNRLPCHVGRSRGGALEGCLWRVSRGGYHTSHLSSWL
jgi:hypothetical protein